MKEPDGKYGKYYIFRKGINGQPPNNLRSYLGSSVWETLGRYDLYYFHCFAKEQPDLNWESPELRQEIYRMINYWLDKGVAGFRIDTIGNMLLLTSIKGRSVMVLIKMRHGKRFTEETETIVEHQCSGIVEKMQALVMRVRHG